MDFFSTKILHRVINLFVFGAFNATIECYEEIRGRIRNDEAAVQAASVFIGETSY